MQKRGQLAVFVVVGIVLLTVVLLLFFFKDKITESVRETPTNPQGYLNQQLNDLKKEVNRCIDKETKDASVLFMKNGGDFSRTFNYMTYSGVNYPILCKAINGTDTCLSQPVLISNFNSKLNNYLPSKVNSCFNFENFKNKDYDLSLGKISVSSEVTNNYVLINLNFSVKLTKGVYSSKSDNFLIKVNTPLGDLFRVTNELVQEKASGKEINPLGYMLSSRNKYNIQVKKPYPDELYDVSLFSDKNYHVYFAIEGIGRFPRPEGRIR